MKMKPISEIDQRLADFARERGCPLHNVREDFKSGRIKLWTGPNGCERLENTEEIERFERGLKLIRDAFAETAAEEEKRK